MSKPQPWYASLNQPPRSPAHGRDRKPNPPTHRDPAQRTDHSSRADDAIDTFTYTWRAIPLPTFAPPSIPYAGVRAGEIIGHRMWWITIDGLCSFAHYRIWQPGETITGDLNAEVGGNVWFKPIYGGIYSYATIDQLHQELARMNIFDAAFPQATHFADQPRPTAFYGIAIGAIKCWGEVIEHERGWRAQFAKLHTIDSVIGITNIEALRERYLPNGQ